MLGLKYHTAKFSEKLRATKMNKTEANMSKPEFLGLSILDIRKITMFEYWHDYAKLKYVVNAKLCYMHRDYCIVHVKSEDVYEKFAGNFEQFFGTSKVKGPLPIGKTIKVNGVMMN